MRPVLAGDSPAQVAEDLAWRRQTVALLLANGTYRLRWLASPKAGANGRAAERAISRGGDPGEPRPSTASPDAVPVAAGAVARPV